MEPVNPSGRPQSCLIARRIIPGPKSIGPEWSQCDSKLDTAWQGASVDTPLNLPGHDGPFAMAHCGGGYMTNLPVEDLTDGKARVAYA
jgi:hypothetical protein